MRDVAVDARMLVALCRAALIAVMQAAEDGDARDLRAGATRLDGLVVWGALIETQVGTPEVVVGGLVLAEQLGGVALVEDDHVVEQLARLM